MKTNFFKRSVSSLLAAVMCLSAFFGIGTTTAFAAAEQKEVYMVSFPRQGDANYGGDWGHSSKTFMNGWKMDSSRLTSVRAMGSYEGNICYCIEPGVGQSTGDTLTKWGENFWDNYPSDYNHTIEPDEIKTFIGRIFQYGYTGTISTSWRSQNEGGDKLAHAVATQILIWETIVGERDSDFNHVGTGGYDTIKSHVSTGHPLYSKIMSYYDSMESSVQKHSKIPSFMAKTSGKAQSIELKWNGKQYKATLVDNNHVLGDYTFSASQTGIDCSVSGNALTITANTAPGDSVTITASKKNSQRRGIITWTDEIIGPNGDVQDVVTYGESVNDPVKGFLKIKVSYGSAKIIKTSEDGKVDGVTFRIQGSGVDQTVQTKNGGQIQINNLMPGIYTVTELTENKYEPQETRRVTVVSGQTSTVTFNNVLKRGNLRVTKTSEDGLNEGIKFHLTGTSLAGLKVDEYAVTDSTGVAVFEDVLLSGSTPYTLEEVDTDIKYVVPPKQTTAIEWNKVTNKGFHNVLKKWSLTVTKSDSEKGLPQGDGSLAGAKYGVFKGDQLMDAYTTDSNGQFTTKSYICGNDWSLREIEPSEGYLLNTESLHIGAEAKLYTAEFNLAAPLDSYETVKKGKIAILKHCDDGSTGIETPEEGAEFEVFLKSAGSYANAQESERDILVCDENGFAETKNLPYGIYTVKQTKGWEGKEMMPAFDVFVFEDGEVYRYLINNATFEALIEIVKKDIETGKIIPAAGIGFKVRNTDTGEYVVQHVNYPTPVDIDTYYTDATGKLMMPEPLPFGNFEIIEVQTCHGYVLDSEPVPFKVDGTQTKVTVEKHNIAQKGTITVGKTGEIFSSVVESDGVYQPVYTVGGIPNTHYVIEAVGDIYTPDGTLRYQDKQVVARLQTGQNGTATTEPLYLGTFKISEEKAAHGMVISNEIKTVELTYAGENIEVTSAEVSFYNERQKAEVSLSKIMEQNELFGIGSNGEILSVQFGLFADENLTAADGSVIPKDGLMEIVNCDENGKAVFKTDLPVGAKLYIKEYSTDEHYLISDKTYPVIFEYAGQDTAAVHISVNEGDPIENKLIRGSVIGKKVDEDGFAICGAVFGLFRADETEFTEETALLTAESNEIGVFGFENVPYGNWVIRELKPAPAFVLNETVYPVTIAEQEEIVEIEIENRFIVGAVQTTKVDAEYPDHKLTGAVFEIYADVDGDKEFNANIDKLIGEMDETEDGVYRMDGLRYNGYFLFEKSAPEGFLKDDHYYYFTIENDGETVIVENEAGVGFVNQPITGELEITKKDISDGKLLPDVGFCIKNDKGEIVAEGYTDENGIAKFTLRYGKYTYQEFDPLDGYKPNDTEYPFEITEDGQIIKAEMSNEKMPVPEVPQTGDSSNIGFFIGLGAVALGGLVSCGIMAIKRKKDDDDE